jgi:Tfp pilus assembly protein PilZ
MVVRLTLDLADKSEWVKIFDPRDCTVFVPTEHPPEVGVQVRVDLAVGASGPRVILHGRVIARRATAEASLAAGCTIAVGFEDREKINYLNGYVRGGLLDLRTRRRLPLRLAVTYGSVDGSRQTFTRDINEEGVFVISEEPLPEDSEVHMRIEIPGQPQPLALAGVVSHTVVVEDEDVPGMGIVFQLKEGQAAELKAVIDSLEDAFQNGRLPDDVLM